MVEVHIGALALMVAALLLMGIALCWFALLDLSRGGPQERAAERAYTSLNQPDYLASSLAENIDRLADADVPEVR